MLAYTARITRVVDHGHETRSLFVERPPAFAWLPGQFVSCQLPIGDQVVTKPYTIASTATGGRDLEFLFNRVPDGLASSYLFTRAVGDTLAFTGPWGTFTFDQPAMAPTVFIAAGTGIAAIRPLLHAAATTPTHALDLLYATAHPLYYHELAALPGVTAALVDEPALLATVTARWIDADTDRTRHFYVCGVGPVILTLRDLLRGAGYARRAVHYEKW